MLLYYPKNEIESGWPESNTKRMTETSERMFLKTSVMLTYANHRLTVGEVIEFLMDLKPRAFPSMHCVLHAEHQILG